MYPIYTYMNTFCICRDFPYNSRLIDRNSETSTINQKLELHLINKNLEKCTNSSYRHCFDENFDKYKSSFIIKNPDRRACNVWRAQSKLFQF